MASRRALKKQVKGVTELAASMCIMAEEYAKDNKEAYNDLLVEALTLRKELLSRISHTEPGNVKGFYKKLHEDLYAGTNDIISKLYELEA